LAEDDVGGGEVAIEDLIWGIHEEAEVAGVEAEEGEALAPMFADGTEHGAVSADGGDEVG
jgi:hypothetical protein